MMKNLLPHSEGIIAEYDDSTKVPDDLKEEEGERELNTHTLETRNNKNETQYVPMVDRVRGITWLDQSDGIGVRVGTEGVCV